MVSQYSLDEIMKTWYDNLHEKVSGLTPVDGQNS